MEWISETALVIPASKNGAVLQLTDGRDQIFGSPYMNSQQAGMRHVPWGQFDDQPNRMARLVEQNNQVRPLLEATRDMIYGTGIGFFSRIVEGKKVHLEPFEDSQLTDWSYETELQNYAIAAINERVTNANHFTRFEFTLEGLPLLSISDGFTTRIGRPVGGRVPCWQAKPPNVGFCQ